MKTLLFLGACLLVSMSVLADSWEVNTDITFRGAAIRSGIKRAGREAKGHVLYLEGLGDSMLNHDPLFEKLNRAGYAVIAFDYAGQGGSGGSMNRTTIEAIGELADIVWEKYVPEGRKKVLLGWSTGGLAAYRYAYRYPEKTDAVILIAPGIAPKTMVGETNLIPFLKHPILCVRRKNDCKLLEITERSLTRNRFADEENPRREGIRPKSPLEVPAFALNLFSTALRAQSWGIDPKVRGLVFLSDDTDTYVHRKKTREVVEKNAAHFELIDYQGTGALHELDNEVPTVAGDLSQRLIHFLNRSLH